MIRIPIFALGALGILAPSLMTGFFLVQTVQSAHERLASVQRLANHEAHLEVLQKNPGFGHAAVARLLARARPGFSGARLIRNVALSSAPRITRSYGGDVLTMSDDGRYIGLNGHSIDDMSRQELLRDLHEFGKSFMDRNR